MQAPAIVDETYNWAYPLRIRRETTDLILHHEAGSGSAQDIHRYHLSLGWSGIAYHYYVRRDGSIYRGRPENAVGGHTKNYNACSIGVCFEGNFETETMCEAQLDAGLVLVADIKRRYPGILVGGHREYSATACPGKNFPLRELKEVRPMTGKDIYDAYNAYAVSLPVPEWAKYELQEAIDRGITDGSNPMQPIPRYQAAIMALRAIKEDKE